MRYEGNILKAFVIKKTGSKQNPFKLAERCPDRVQTAPIIRRRKLRRYMLSYLVNVKNNKALLLIVLR